MLHEWLSDEPKMELVRVSRDKARDTVLGHELLGKIYPVDFWQKIKVKRLPIRVKEIAEVQIPIAKEEKEETLEKPIALKHVAISIILILLIVVGGLSIYYFNLESLKEPKFNVFDFDVGANSVAVYVQNVGSKDAHSIRVEVHGYSFGRWLHLNIFDNSGPNEIKVGDVHKVVLECANNPLGHDRYKVVVSCEEGITQESIFEIV